MKKLFGILAFLAAALLLTTGIIFYARGYRPNLKEKSLQGTGIVSIKSKPQGAAVSINGEQKGTTDLDITDLSPGKYKIKITKEGFSTWEKEEEVKKEAVNLIEAVLFPVAPSLRALTFTGVASPLASPVGDKIVFALSGPKETAGLPARPAGGPARPAGGPDGKAGIWALNLSTSPLPSFFVKDLVQLASDTKEFAFSSGEYQFSPNGKQMLVKLAGQSIFFLLETSKKNENPKEVTLDVDKIRQDWNQKASSDTKNQLKSLGKSAETTASGLTNLAFSTDKNSFFGLTADGLVVLYAGKPEPNGSKPPKIFNLPKAEKYFWYPDNKHVILVNKEAISITEIDGTNNVTIYTSNFDPNFLAPWPDGSRLVIATTLNSSISSLPNLYAIELH